MITFSAISPSGTKTVTAVPDATHIVLASATNSRGEVVGQSRGARGEHQRPRGGPRDHDRREQRPEPRPRVGDDLRRSAAARPRRRSSAASPANAIEHQGRERHRPRRRARGSSSTTARTSRRRSSRRSAPPAPAARASRSTAPLARPHASGAAFSGLGIVLTAPLTLAHASGRPIGDPLATTAVTSVSNGATIQDCTFGGSLEADANNALAANAGCTNPCGANVALRIYAGYDETSVWQEFGEMMFQTQDDVPSAVWGNPNPLLPNWVRSRYVPWTSWYAGAAAVGPVVDPPGRELGHDHPRDRATTSSRSATTTTTRTSRRTTGSAPGRGT